MRLKLIVVVVSLLLGIARTAGVKSEFYQAVAHIWVALLYGLAFGMAMAVGSAKKLYADHPAVQELQDALSGLLLTFLCSAVGITTVEIVVSTRNFFAARYP